jgi:hypothetical protein
MIKLPGFVSLCHTEVQEIDCPHRLCNVQLLMCFQVLALRGGMLD